MMENAILSQMTVYSAIRLKTKMTSSLSKTFKLMLVALTFVLFSGSIFGQATYYSYQTGPWNDVNTWTTDPSGSTRVGAAVPNGNSTVVILTDRTVSLTANVATTNLSIQINDGGVLDLGTFAFSGGIRSLSGQGVFRLGSASFPNVTTNTFVNENGGTVEYTTSSNFTLPTSITTYNNLSINTSGSTAIQSTNLTLNGDLIVRSGVFQINNTATTALQLTVNGDVNVESNGSIRVGTGVTNRSINNAGTGGTAPFTNYYTRFHRVVIYGNFTNNGSVRFTNQSMPVYDSFPSTTRNEYSGAASVFFMGASNNTVTLNGQTDFYNLVVNKGTDQTYSLTIFSSSYNNFRLFGANVLASEGTTGASNQRKALWIRTGTLILDGMIVIPSLSEGTTNNSQFVIPSTAALQINGADVAVFTTADSYREVNLAYGTAATTDGQMGITQGAYGALNVFGTLTVNNGVLSTKESAGIMANNTSGQIIINDGAVDAKQILYQSGSALFELNGGEVYVRGRLRRTPASYSSVVDLFDFSTVTLGTARATNGVNTSYASFNIESAGSKFNMTGGTINIYDGVTTGTANTYEVNSSAGNYSVTGGMVAYSPISGTGAANATAFTMSSVPPIGGFSLYRETGTTTVNLLSDINVVNDLFVDAGVLNTNNHNVTIGGNFAVDPNGVYNAGTNTTTFTGDLFQYVYVNSNNPLVFNNLVIDKPSSRMLTFNGEQNNVTVSGNLSINQTIVDDGGLNISVAGNVNNTGVLTGDGSLTLNGTNSQVISGGGTFGNVVLNNTNSSPMPISLAGNMTVNGTLTFSNDKLFNIGTYGLTLGEDATIVDAGANRFFVSAGNAGDGGVTKIYSETSSTFTFPLGTYVSGARYTPATIGFSSNPSTYGALTIVPVSSSQPNTSSNGSNLRYYWHVKQTGFTGIANGSVTHTFTYSEAHVHGAENQYVPGVFNYNTLTWNTGTTSSINRTANTISDWNGSGNQLAGDYTAGHSNNFDAPTVFYSRQSGPWNSATTWSTVGHNGAAASSYPALGDIAIIGGRDSVYLVTSPNTPNQGAVSVSTLMIEAGSVLDAGFNPGSVFNTVVNHRDGNGNGTIRVAAQYNSPAIFEFPAGDFSDFNQNMGTTELYTTNATTGTTYFLPSGVNNYGNLVLAPLGGSNIIFPNFDLLIYGDLIIKGQNADSWFCPTWGVTYGPLYSNAAAIAKTITINGDLDIQGGSLVWFGNGNIAQNFVINGDLTIAETAGVYIRSGNAGTGYTYREATNQSITLGGNLINNARGGTIGGANNQSVADFTNITLIFNGSENAYITNTTGANASVSTTFGNVIVNKGSNMSTTLTLDIAGTLSTPTNNWLTLLNGTFIYNRTNPSSNFTISTTSPFTIPSTAALDINYTSDSRNVLIANANSNNNDLLLNGRLVVRSGRLYVGPVSSTNYNNDIVYSGTVGSSIEISGGELIVNGQIRRDASTTNGALSYTQAGGNVTINGRNQLASYAKLEVLNPGSIFNMWGGTLTIVNGGGTAYGDLYLRPSSYNVTGGTIAFGSSSSSQTYSIESNIPLYNMVIGATGSASRIATVNIMTSPLDLNGDLTINTNGRLNSNNRNVMIAGNLMNNGTYNFGTNKTIFDGDLQTITGNTVTNFNKLQVLSTSSLTTNHSFNVADSLIINQNATLILGNYGITLQGNMLNNGAYSNNNVANSGVIFNGTGAQTVTGAEGSFDRVEINKSSGTLTAESNISLLSDLVMTRGLFNIGSNRLFLNQTCSIVANNPFGVTNMIVTNGVSSSLGVRKYFGIGATTFTYPVGVAGKYTPVVFNIAQNTSPGYINVVPVDAYQPSVDIPEQSLDYYWTIDNGGMTIEATANFYYSDNDVRGDESAYLAARMIPQTGTWYQSNDLNSVDETNNIINYSFTYPSTNINGDYTAGTDPAIHDVVPKYQTNANGDWSDPSIWTPLDNSAPCPAGGPFGADVIIDHNVTISTNNVFSNSVTINDTLRIDPTTSGHNFTQLLGDGVLYLENGNMPGGDYTTFVDCSGNATIVYGGTGSYQIVADLYNSIPNLILAGSGTRIMPNVDLTICSRFVIDGPVADNSVNNRDLYILGTMERYNSGSFVAGSGTVIFDGAQTQTIGGLTGDFSGSDRFNNLRISNPNGVVIGDNALIEVGNMLYLDEGLVYTTASNQLRLSNLSPNAVVPEGGSASSYVSGPLTKQMANGASFVFPIGKGLDKGHKFTVTSDAGTGVVLDWTAEYFTPNTNLTPLIPPIQGVNTDEYWTVAASAPALANIQIAYDNTSGLTPQMITGGLEDMRIAEYVSGWRELSTTATLESNNIAGEVRMSLPTQYTTVSTTPKQFTTASASETLPRAAMRPIGGGNIVCGTSDGIPVVFSSSSQVIGFPIELTYMIDGFEYTDVISSAPLEWTISTPAAGTYWLTGFTYSGGLPGVVDGSTVIVYDNSSILSDAGPDQEICGGYQTILSASTPPLDATGRWTIILGSGGQFTGASGSADPNAGFKGISGETYILRWTISNGFCTTYDDVQISFPVAPSQPGNFTTGSPVVCQNTTQVYTVPMIYGNTYNWSYSGQGVTFSGNTNSVVATFDANATSGVISVTASNSCGTSDYARTMAITVNPMPTPSIVGDGIVCPGSVGIEYETAYNAGSTYNWTVTNGIITSTNANGNVITVTWNTPASVPVTGAISVTEQTAAGCSATATMNVSVNDNEPPTLVGTLPTTITDINACYIDATTPPAGVPTFMSLLSDIESAYVDACGGTVNVYLANTSVTGNSCGWIVTYTYNVVDTYGNALNNQTLQYSGYSQSLPVITGGTNNGVVSCVSDALVAPHLLTPSVMPTVVDPCTGSPIIYTSYTSPAPVTCNGTMEYVYTYTACSGYTVAWSYTYVVDIEDFSIIPNGASTVACFDEITVPVPPTVTDNCGNVIAPVGPAIGGTHTDCSGEVTYTWTYTDCEGNTHDWVYTYTIADNIAPTFTAPANITVYFNDDCTYDISVVVTGDVVDEADNCLTSLEATFTDGDMVAIGNGAYTITRTWTLSDCNNTTTHTQVITLMDNTVPVISNCPANINVNTDEGVDYATVTVATPTVVDCSSTTITNDFNGTNNASGQYPVGTTTVIYTVTDAAGNFSTCSFNVTVTDNQLPVINCVADAVVMEDVNVNTYTHHGTSWNSTATDNVGVTSLTYAVTGATVAVTGSNTTLDGQIFNEGVTIVTWTATDAAGNTSTCSFNVTVVGRLTVEITSTNVTCYGMSNGTATAVVTGGTQPYTYSWNTIPVATTSTVENLAPATYVVTVRDAYNNEATASVTITQPEILQIANSEVTDVLCFGYSTGAIEITAVGGTLPYMYSINGGTSYQNDNIFSNLTAGTYYIRVRDANGCTTSISAVTINQPSTSLSGTVVSQTNIACYGESFGSVTVLGAGGMAPYQYSIDGGESWQISGTYSNLIVGNYTVIVRDANMCTYNVAIEITTPSALNYSITNHVNNSCFGGTDGSFTVTATGGTSPYRYSINGGTQTANGTYSGLSAGTYTVVIVDANYCTRTVEVEITEPSQLVINIESQTDIVCDGNVGSVTVSAEGGVAPYQYRIDSAPFGTQYVFNNLTAGDHQITVVDANNCTVTRTVTISVIPFLTGNILSVSNVTCNGGNDGSITVRGADGMAPYRYRVSTNGEGAFSDPVNAGNSYVAENLTAGTYIVQIRDANNCLFTFASTVEVTEPTAVVASASVTDAILCNGDSGEITIVATGGTGILTYTLGTIGNNNTGVFANVPAGTYAWTVADANGCEVNGSITIDEPTAVVASASVTDAILCNGETGEITITAAGGTGALTYTLGSLGSNNTGVFANVPAGTYTWTVADANGCEVNGTITIDEPTLLTASASVTDDILCNGELGEITIAAAGGTGVLTYTLGTIGSNNSGIFTNVPAGTYTWSVADVNGCMVDGSITIDEPTAIVANATVTSSILYHGGTGVVTVTATDGTGAYAFTLTGADTFTSTDGIFNAVPSGSYTWIVTDANGCEVSGTILLPEPDELLAVATVSQMITCNGGMASVTITVSGGTAPYTFGIEGIGTNDTGLFENIVPAGTFNWSVTDANMNEVTGVVTVEEPAVLTASFTDRVDILCNGTLASVTVVADGGTAPYTYTLGTITNGTGVFTNIAEGDYDVLVVDANLCEYRTTISFVEPEAMLVSVDADSIYCFGTTTTVTLTVTNGVAPYTYTLGTESNATGVFENVVAGSYTWSVVDINGCETNGSIVLNQPDHLDVAVSATEILCNGSTSTAIFTVTGGVLPYTYTLGTFVSDGTGVFENIPAGRYGWSVVDGNGCEVIDTIDIVEPQLLEAVAAVSTPISVTGGTGVVTITAIGGTLPYTYTFGTYTSDGTGVFEDVTAGRYPWSVVDGNGCEVLDTLVVIEPSILEATAMVTVPIECFGGTATVTITALGGIAPYDYTFDGVTLNSDTIGVFTGIPAGTYIWSVRDVTGSTIFDQTLVITEPDAITATAEITRAIICNGENAEVTITASGGTGQYVYNLNGIINNTGVFEIAADSGLVWSVTDASNCAFDGGIINIPQPDAIVVTIDKTDVLCNGTSTGTATANVEDGSGTYTFIWSNGEEGNTITNLAAGIYTVVVSDGTCSYEEQVEILQPDAITISASVTNAKCPESHDGSITLTINGGVGPYNIFWADGNTSQNRTGLGVGTYSVVVSDVNGCSASLDVEVSATLSQDCLNIPTIFTPNGDGVNDEWIITNINAYPKAEIKVYTRWGKLVFHSKNLSEDPWDGRFNGRLLPVDSYHYILNLHDGSEEMSGVITIIR